MMVKSPAGPPPERYDAPGGSWPPGPKGLPFLGNLLEFRRDALRYYSEWSRQYGDIVALRLGVWPAVLLNHSDHAEYVLVRNANNFIKFPFFFRHVHAIFGRGLLTSEGEFWHRQRRLAAPAFHTQRLAGYGDAMVRYTTRMLENWRPGDLRDVHADSMALTCASPPRRCSTPKWTRTLPRSASAFNTIVEEISVRLRRPFRIPDAVPTPGNIRYVRGGASDQSAGDQDHTRAARTGWGPWRPPLHADAGPRRGRPADVGAPIAGRGGHAAGRRPRDHGRRALLDVVSAGPQPRRGRKAGGGIARRPRRAAAGRERLAAASLYRAGGDRVLRLYPPAWGFGRQAIAECEIGGYAIPAGTTIIISPWVLHRDPRYFEHPDEFRPERWSGDFARQLPRFAYIPFGGGPRICIGNRFAMMEVVLILATVAQRYQLQLQDSRPVVPLPSITLRPKGGVPVKLAPRAP